MIMSMRCDIVIPVWNQLEVTGECVDSIVKHTDYPYRLIMIDNGSGSLTQKYLKDMKEKRAPDLHLIRNDENLGFVKAVNQGLSASTAAYVCVMNNDTLATDGWLAEMVRVMESDAGLGLVNPSSNTSGQFPAKGESIDDYAAGLKPLRGETQELYTCRGFCMLIKREVLDWLGGFDETYSIGYFEETDYCRRARAKGYGMVRAKASYVYHREGVTFREIGDNKKIFKQNEKIFFERWGRRLRVGYFVGGADPAARVNEIATGVARSGHQAHIFLKAGLDWPVNIDHFEIRRRDLPSIFFGAAALYKILKRRKKKRLDLILTDDPVFGNILKFLKFLHGSDVLVNPTRDMLLTVLGAKARQFS